jgi:hypothetical protein
MDKLLSTTAIGRLLTPEQAAQRLTELGRPTKVATLNTWRTTGGGPPFYKSGKYILYADEDLVEFAKSTPMVKYNSTSEYSTRKKTPKPDGALPESSGSDPDDGEGE